MNTQFQQLEEKSKHLQSAHLYNITFTDLKQIHELTNSGSGFRYQWSYDKMQGFSNTKPNPQYFRLGENGLEINIYKDDLKFNLKTDSQPRTQLRGLGRVYDNIKYVLSFDQFLVNLPSFDYAWAQIYGANGPNVILKWRKGYFQVSLSQGDMGSIKFPGKPEDIVGKWVNWRIQFMLSEVNGYLRVYQDNVLMANFTGNNSGANDSYIKIGIYCQKMKPSNDVKLYLRNLHLFTVEEKKQN